MRFHTTLAFSEAREEYKAARHQYATFDDSDAAAEAQANARLDRADEQLWGIAAITPTEVAEKIRAAKERAGDDFPIEAFYSVERMLADLDCMQGWPLSPDFVMAWRAWRNITDELANVKSGEDEDRWTTVQAQLYAETVMRKCTTPDDFILKQYLRLHTTIGGTAYGEAKADMTGNPWDIDITKSHSKPRFECADELGCYDDIDATDIGANLLAYGLPYFDAEAWMERAVALGQGVSLVQQARGGWSLGIHLVYPEEDEGQKPSARVQRERDRLIRILNFQGGIERHRALGDEIRRNWPQFIHALPAEVREAVA